MRNKNSTISEHKTRSIQELLQCKVRQENRSMIYVSLHIERHSTFSIRL